MRQRYTTEEKLAFVADWKASGLSRRKYALTHGIPQTSLLAWSKGQNLPDRRNLEARRKFVELREQGLSPWKISLALGARWETCHRWERMYAAGVLSV